MSMLIARRCRSTASILFTFFTPAVRPENRKEFSTPRAAISSGFTAPRNTSSTFAMKIFFGARLMSAGSPDIAMSGDPADISRAPKNIFIANVEDVFRGAVNPDEIAARGVENSFRFSGRTAGVKNVKRMLAVERHRRAISIDIFQLPMPPHVAAFFHVNVASGASKDNYTFDRLVA